MGHPVSPAPQARVEAGEPWTSPAAAAAGGPWHFVGEQDGLPVAHAAQRFWAVGDGLRRLSALAPGRGVGAGDDGATPGRTPVPGAPRRAVGRRQRQPECQDGHPEQRGGVGREQKNQRAQAPLVGRHARADRGRRGDSGQRRGSAGLDGSAAPLLGGGGDPPAAALGGDGGYRAEWLHAWVWSFKRTPKIDGEVVEHTGKGLQVVPHRWVVERTFAWLLHYRRHRCDDEVLTANSEAMMQISMIHLLLKRLA
jgi:transposase